MLLKSPAHLHYPITVTELLRKAEEKIEKNEPLISYYYKSLVTEGNKYGEERQVDKVFTTKLESEVEGKLISWKISAGQVIQQAGYDFHAPELIGSTDLVEIEEACRHDVQFGGMCAVCGKDMTEIDYGTSVPDLARANVNMMHGNTALRISQNEAERVEETEKRRLLEAKKLSLVVDLDQTIIHATVDPTVEEWMNDKANPNHAAVEDVQKFQLEEDGTCAGNWYYVKLRPGLRHFLAEIAKLFECHIYTMGTRAYAHKISGIVDPDKAIFGDRILSRDESGSLTAKSLHRLFPVDTRMVVIIDDRGDVWNWSPNLVKVVAYDFFKGIGDINSSFLPKQEGVVPPDGPDLEADQPAAPDTTIDENDKEDPETVLARTLSPENSTVESLLSMGGKNDAGSAKAKASQQDEQLRAQIAERPLLQEQRKLDQAEEIITHGTIEPNQEDEQGFQDNAEAPRHRQNLLQDDDDELYFLERILKTIHTQFFQEYHARFSSYLDTGRLAELKGGKSVKKRPDLDMSLVPDVRDLMMSMKTRCLSGKVLTFSGIIPLSTTPVLSDLGRWSLTFGASVSNNIDKHTTHVIGARHHTTAKMRGAAARPRIRIVAVQWLYQMFRKWELVDETPYLIHVDAIQSKLSDSEDIDGSTVSFGDEESVDHFPKLLGSDDEHHEDDDSQGSPIDDIDEGDWDDMMGEFDSESDDSETASVKTVEDSNRKRKREDETPVLKPLNKSGESESERQKRKKRVWGRTSSLVQVTTADESSVEHSSEDKSRKARGLEQDMNDDFEAFMARQLAEETDAEDL